MGRLYPWVINKIYMDYRKQVGQFGEQLAQDFLIKRGYRIIEQNVKLSYQEIDIVASYKNLLVFVEVKTRTNQTFGVADESITHGKIQNLKKAIGSYVEVRKKNPENVRLDLIAVDINRATKIAKIKHVKDLF